MADETTDIANTNADRTKSELEISGINITPEGADVRANASAVPPARQQSKGNGKAEGDLPRIRTYAADMNAAIQKRGATLSSIVSAEKSAEEKRPRAAQEPEKKRTLLLGIAALVLILVGAGAVGTTIFLGQRAAEEEVRVASIISPNRVVRASLDGEAPLERTLGDIRRDTSLSLGEVMRIDVMHRGVPAAPGDILSALGLPEALRREVTAVMVGVHAFDRNQPFLILSVSAYDRSFGALLAGESEMGRNLGTFFAPTGASGLPPILSFSDTILQNIDVRRSQSAWPILYGYPTRNIVVITTNEFTLREILSRLASMRP